MPGSPVTGSKSSPVNLRTESFVASSHLFVCHLMLECALQGQEIGNAASSLLETVGYLANNPVT